MSLNGLDSSHVTAAFQNTLNELGGWLLLKYISRDEVDVLSQGHGGFSEAAAAIAAYEEKSPLYGFLLYRRRKVVLKYVPEGTSRLLLARTAVHFQAVQDKFSPHDAALNVSSANEITDAVLSASCSLHTASSRSSSLRKQNLLDISEDNENRTDRPNGTPDVPNVGVAQAASGAQEGSSAPTHARRLDPIISREEIGDQPTAIKATDPSAAVRTSTDIPSETESAFNEDGRYQDDYRPDTSYSGKPSLMNEDYLYSAYAAAQKKEKSGPRPITGDRSRRTTSATTAARQKMPAGVKATYRKHEDDSQKSPRKHSNRSRQTSDVRPKSRRGADDPLPSAQEGSHRRVPSRVEPLPTATNKTGAPMAAPIAGPSQASTSKSAQSPAFDVTSVPALPSTQPDVSSKSVPVALPSTSEAAPYVPSQSRPELESRPDVLSPEKLRLMKALEMRKKRLAQGQTLPVDDLSEDRPKADSAVGIVENSASDQQPANKADQVSREAVTNTKPELAPLQTSPPTRFPAADEQAGRTSAGDGIASAGFQTITRSLSQQTRPSVFDQTSPTSEDMGSLADDDLISELEHVKLQEAQTVQMPTTPDDRRTSNQQLGAVTSVMIKPMTSSTPLREPRGASDSPRSPATGSPVEERNHGRPGVSPTPERSRRLSSMSKPSNDAVSLSKRTNLSSGISRRIQALAEHSSRETSPHSTYRSDFARDHSAPYLNARNLSQQSEVGGRSNSFVRPKIPAGSSRASSPSRSIFRAFKSGVKAFQGQSTSPVSSGTPSVYSDFSAPKQYEARTVTARIVRRPDLTSIESRLDENPQPMQPSGREFARTPTTTTVATNSGSTNFGQRPHTSAAARPGSRESAFSTVTKASWKAFGRKKGDREKEKEAAQQQEAMMARKSFSSTSLEKVDEFEETKSNSSKTSRVWKRISGMSSGGGRKSTSNRSEKEAGRKGSAASNSGTVRGTEVPKASGAGGYAGNAAMPSGFGVGDLNVQFPDSLLWKRRYVEISSDGQIILTTSPRPSQSLHDRRPQTASSSFVKRYRLSEFRCPAIPSQERQELPCSVVLDFKNGGTLQLACGDSLSQASILKRMRDVWEAWNAVEG